MRRNKKISGYGNGFTFIEIFCVVTIIALCLVLVRVAYNYRDNSIKTNIAREELALLNCAIELFKSKNGSYPICKSKAIDDSAKQLYADLSKDPSLLKDHKWRVEDEMLIDQWGKPYLYKCFSPESVSYVLMSMGPNMHIDEVKLIDDIYSR